ncbi:hypothetical protein C6499_10865 [Candidatus Poribacteria bacterium]|nr:MAG: hypothetical protein C6499_10865 [Candidatus Poribacteria bacterium]
MVYIVFLLHRDTAMKRSSGTPKREVISTATMYEYDTTKLGKCQIFFDTIIGGVYIPNLKDGVLTPKIR